MPFRGVSWCVMVCHGVSRCSMDSCNCQVVVMRVKINGEYRTAQQPCEIDSCERRIAGFAKVLMVRRISRYII
jgi:hypothetical protein